MTKYRKHNVRLPEDVTAQFATLTRERDRNAYIKALRERGWTFESIALITELTRERIRQVCVAIPVSEALRIAIEGYPLPEPPRTEPKLSAAESGKYVEPSEETLARLLELQPFAQQVRSYGTAFRKEAEEYTWLINHAHTVEGVTLYRLAKRLGVTHGALRFRLARYGYKAPKSAESGAYTPILPENRYPFDKGTATEAKETDA